MDSRVWHLSIVCAIIGSVMHAEVDMIRIYNGTGKPLVVTGVLYTTKNHTVLHKEQDAIPMGVLRVHIVMSGNWVDVKRPAYSFNVDRDIWFGYRECPIAYALSIKARDLGAQEVYWFNVGSSVKELFIADYKGVPKVYTSEKAFDHRGYGTPWKEVTVEKAGRGFAVRSYSAQKFIDGLHLENKCGW